MSIEFLGVPVNAQPFGSGLAGSVQGDRNQIGGVLGLLMTAHDCLRFSRILNNVPCIKQILFGCVNMFVPWEEMGSNLFTENSLRSTV